MSRGFHRVPRTDFAPVEEGGCPLWNERRSKSRYEAWLDLNALAWEAPREVRLSNGEMMDLAANETPPLSVRVLVARWGWGSKDRVSGLLALLEEGHRLRPGRRTPHGQTYIIHRDKDSESDSSRDSIKDSEKDRQPVAAAAFARTTKDSESDSSRDSIKDSSPDDLKEGKESQRTTSSPSEKSTKPRVRAGVAAHEAEPLNLLPLDDAAPPVPPPKVKPRPWRHVPPEWSGPKERHRVAATALGLDLVECEKEFRDHEFRITHTDADKAFDTWLKNAARWGNGVRSRSAAGARDRADWRRGVGVVGWEEDPDFRRSES